MNKCKLYKIKCPHALADPKPHMVCRATDAECERARSSEEPRRETYEFNIGYVSAQNIDNIKQYLNERGLGGWSVASCQIEPVTSGYNARVVFQRRIV